ncbi:MAG: hypothetical protein I8H71_00425 [Xanthomonadaceae bacterium]|nr:hypothetical protein [Xanthomonadaceae bacterium]MBH2008138.1 hypothetical protein [Xanthomonadaceae bacterium]
MPILAGDIKLIASKVMDDVPEGGGGPTGVLIVDGASNNVFADISEVERAGGRVSFRQLHVGVQSDNTDTYLGGNIIIGDPPNDPNVTLTLFAANNLFDTRTEAATRVESFLTQGSVAQGYLFESHIAGQRVIQIVQRPDSEEPTVGQTLALIMPAYGLNPEVMQYVRVTEVTSTLRLFYDGGGSGDYQAKVVACRISDALRYDFLGSPPSRSFMPVEGRAIMRETVVADAGVYAGISPITAAAVIGDYTINVASIFSQLVPSAQTETPLSDIRTNGLATALVATGSPVVRTISMGFTTTQRLFAGGPIYPGSLSIVRDGVTLTDDGGTLRSAGTEVGQVSYDDGILSLSTDVWGPSPGTYTLTFIPAATPELISDQRAIAVTAESRGLTYVLTMDDIPVPRSLSISYLAQGRWYVLRDNGSGVLRGSALSMGIGTLSYLTGSLSVTLGALPDIGSSILIQSFSRVATVQASNTILLNGGKAYVPINTSGALSEEAGVKTIQPGALSVTWMDGTLKTATDDGNGNLTGDATGTVNYALGTLLVSPNALPPMGTVFTLGAPSRSVSTAVGVLIASGNLGATDITPGSVSFDCLVTFSYHTRTSERGSFNQKQITVTFFDDRAGNICFMDETLLVPIGTINYATGALSVGSVSIYPEDINGPTVHDVYGDSAWSWNKYCSYPWSGANRTYTIAASANVRYSASASTANTVIVTVSQYLIRTLMVPNYTLKGVGFSLGGTDYQQLVSGVLHKDVDPMTGGGIPAGSVSGALGTVFVSAWAAGASSAVSNWRGLISPPSVGVEAPFSAFSTIFRTATSPLRPGSLSVLGTLQDGTTFNLTAGTDGKINETRVKGKVNFEFGLVELYFVNPAGDPAISHDLTPLGIIGLTTAPADLVMLNSLRYNAVSLSYLPLDAGVIGLDPVRLPSDGKVPIYRDGGFVVLGHTGVIGPVTVTNGQVLNCARTRLSRVRLLDAGGIVINVGYSQNLEAGTVTFADVSSYTQPVTLEHRIEDMAIVRESQITGAVVLTRPITHDYPLGSYLSSALMCGDMKARVSMLFDQASWDGITWMDDVNGDPSMATFNDTLAPVLVTNIGAITERWAIRMDSDITFTVIGEHVGVIATGTTGTACAPINPSTGFPYFTINYLGWGSGWSVGNILRINTVGAIYPFWALRTIQQGPEAGIDYDFTILTRGDINRP